MTFPPITLAVSVAGACGVLLWRLRETTRPITKKAILIPPLAMSTGSGMFLFEPFQVPILWALGALVLGAVVFALPLIRTSELSKIGEEVYLRRSKAFLWVLLALVVVRLGLKGYVEQYISLLQTAGLFYLLAFGMIVRWRVDMYRRYCQIVGSASKEV